MKIHILGICGTFMGSLAIIARQLGHDVSGSDENVYPPMSTQLEAQGIKLYSGYLAEHLDPAPDLIIVGNALSRGRPAVEYMLNQRLPFVSGPQWLFEHVLQQRTVIAISGTHGKTTTTGMIAWILQCAGKNPGFLIGGVPKDFAASAELGSDPYFVIEADEYDTAFFDKRSKFIHYHPNVLILNNLEFDHGDIFADLNAIKKQFAFLLRTMPQNGLIIYPEDDANLKDVLQQGCWSETVTFGTSNAFWQAKNISQATDSFDVYQDNINIGRVNWNLLGLHNIRNALGAFAVADRLAIPPAVTIHALNQFAGIKRRLEIKGKVNEITVYDDFAHHPTALAATLDALRAKVAQERIIAVTEFGSNTMRAGMHGEKVFAALQKADLAFVLRPKENWDIESLIAKTNSSAILAGSIEDLINKIVAVAKPHDHILIMSNKSFGGIHEKLLKSIQATASN